jgi:hypothetical protein
MVVRGRVQDGVVVLANGVRLPEGKKRTCTLRWCMLRSMHRIRREAAMTCVVA